MDGHVAKDAARVTLAAQSTDPILFSLVAGPCLRTGAFACYRSARVFLVRCRLAGFLFGRVSAVETVYAGSKHG